MPLPCVFHGECHLAPSQPDVEVGKGPRPDRLQRTLGESIQTHDRAELRVPFPSGPTKDLGALIISRNDRASDNS